MGFGAEGAWILPYAPTPMPTNDARRDRGRVREPARQVWRRERQ